MQKFLETIIRQIVGEEVEFDINSTELYPGSIEFSVKIADEHKPHLIGRGGKTIKSMTDLVNLAGRKINSRARIKILD